MTLINLLRHISLKRLMLHKTHTLMSVFGIALGVSAVVSIGIVSSSVVRSFEDSITSLAGKANLQITNGQSGLPEMMIERVQAVKGVEYAVPVVETAATLVNGRNRSIMIIGVDMLQDQHIRDYRVSDETTEIPDPLLFLAKPDSVLLSRGLARENNVHIDQTVQVETVRGLRSLTVRGLLEPEGPAKVMNSSLVVMDIFAAQLAFGKEGRIDRIDVSVLRSEDVNTVQRLIHDALPGEYTVESPSVRSGQIEGTIANLKRNISSIGFLAICIGMYLIYNAVSIAVVQRRREIGVLRALGATRRSIVKLFLAETLFLSFAGSALGIGLGVLFAHASIAAVGQTISVQYQLTSTDAVPVIISFEHLLTGFALGLITSVLAALVPAFAAARVTPVTAIRSLPFSDEEFISRNRLMFASGLLLAIAAGSMASYGAIKHVSPKYIPPLIMLAEFSLFFGFTFALPFILRRFIDFFQHSLAPHFGTIGRLAGLNIRKNINRNAVAAGAVLLAVGLFVSVSNIIFSARHSVMNWVEATSRYDLFVSAGSPFAGHSGKSVPLPLDFRDEIEQIEGVRCTDLYRGIFIPFNGSKILLQSMDIRRRLEASTLLIAQGDLSSIAQQLPDKDNVVISESLALRKGIKKGDRITLTTPGGLFTFGVAAVIVDFSYEFGSILMDTATFQRHWNDHLADYITVQLEKDHDASRVRDAIERSRGKEMRLFVLTLAEFNGKVEEVMDKIYNVFHAMDILALSIACLGIIITLLASVFERSREIGIIRSIGALRRQISSIVVMESVLMGLVGGLVGIISGTITGWMGIEGFVNGEAGMSVPYLVDYAAIFKAVILIIVFSALSGLYPAWRAAKTNIVEALSYE